MNFGSDNTGRVHARIMDALVAANHGHVPSYGADAITRAAQDRVREVFDAPEAAVHFVATGTAANALALSLVTPGWGRVFCHEDAHIQTSETGAPEFYMAGGKLMLVPGEGGKMTAQSLRNTLETNAADSVHAGQNVGLSITNATEVGTIYTPDEVTALSQIAHDAGLAVHMDGARFANALAAQGCAPADLTWRAGVDLLSLGGTKNGCMGAEAVIIFDPAKSMEFEYRRKRGGHLFSKHRYLAAQILAWLDGDLWLKLAGHANQMAHELASGLVNLADVSIVHRVETNGVFITLPKAEARRLAQAGASFHEWPCADLEPGHSSLRLICGWDTEAEDVARFLSVLRQG